MRVMFSSVNAKKHLTHFVLMFFGIICFILNIGLYHIPHGLGIGANIGVIVVGSILFLWGGIAVAKDFRTLQCVEKTE